MNNNNNNIEQKIEEFNNEMDDVNEAFKEANL